MKDLKTVLTENRESVISSIKWAFKIWKDEDVKAKMIEFFAFCENSIQSEEKGSISLEMLNGSKRIKSDLKHLVNYMERNQQSARDIAKYGTANPKLADIMGGTDAHGNIKEFDLRLHLANKNGYTR